MRRDKKDIIYDMIRLASNNGGVKKTQFMSRVNMSFLQLSERLELLIKGGYMEEKNFGDDVKYVASGKGKKFAKDMDEFREKYVDLFRK
jgi:predicted transcriptional regulator